MKKKWLIAAVCALMLVLTACGSKGEMTQAPMKATNASTETAKHWETNVLRSDEIPDDSGIGMEYPVLGSEYQRKSITSVTFLDTLANMPEDSWDVSEAENGTVMAWVKRDGDLYQLYIAGEGGVSAGRSCRDLFAGYCKMEWISFGNSFHTNAVEDMGYMFSHCRILTELDLNSFDTANVQDMSGMFINCLRLTELNVSSFDTDKVLDMGNMFVACALTELDLSGFNTANVQNMSRMFDCCGNLTELNLSAFDTANVQDMSSMFRLCSDLTKLDLSSFDTSNVKNMKRMFSGCSSLIDLKLNDRFVTTNASYGINDMFEECPAGDDYQQLLN